MAIVRACSDLKEAEAARALGAFNYCMCRKDGGDSKECAERWVEEPENPWWATLFG